MGACMRHVVTKVPNFRHNYCAPTVLRDGAAIAQVHPASSGEPPLSAGPKTTRNFRLFAHLAEPLQKRPTRIVSVSLCFFANAFELFLEAGESFVRKFFQVDKFISSAFQRSD